MKWAILVVLLLLAGCAEKVIIEPEVKPQEIVEVNESVEDKTEENLRLQGSEKVFPVYIENLRYSASKDWFQFLLDNKGNSKVVLKEFRTDNKKIDISNSITNFAEELVEAKSDLQIRGEIDLECVRDYSKTSYSKHIVENLTFEFLFEDEIEVVEMEVDLTCS